MKKYVALFIVLILIISTIIWNNCNDASVSEFLNLNDTTNSIFFPKNDSSSTSSTTTNNTSSTDTTPPSIVPKNFTIDNTGKNPILKWTNPTEDNDFDHVKIIRKQGSKPNNIDDGTTVYTGTDSTYTDTTELSDGTWYYTIYSCDKNGNCMSTGITTSSYIDKIPPSDIESFSGIYTGTELILTWTNPTDEDYAGIKIFRDLKNCDKITTDSTVLFQIDDTEQKSISDTSCQKGNKYCYKAYTFDKNGNFSNGVEYTTNLPALKVIVDSSTNSGKYTSLEVNGDSVYISYHNGPDTMDATDCLKFARSDDSGYTWLGENTKTIVSNYCGYQTSLALNGNNIFISYISSSQMYGTYSDDNGSTWTNKLIEGVPGNGSSIFYSNGRVLVSYQGSTSALRCAYSDDNTSTWTPNSVLTETVDTKTSITGKGFDIYLTYRSGTYIKFIHSSDNGFSWDSPTNVLFETSPDNPSIAIDGSNVYIPYYSSSSNLRFAFSIDSGVTWTGGNTRTIDSDSGSGEYNSIDVDDGIIYVSYYSSATLKLAISKDNGSTWITDDIVVIDSGNDVGKYNSIDVVDGVVYISYYDETTKCLKFARYTP